jgi:hypothetical protein
LAILSIKWIAGEWKRDFSGWVDRWKLEKRLLGLGGSLEEEERRVLGLGGSLEEAGRETSRLGGSLEDARKETSRLSGSLEI